MALKKRSTTAPKKETAPKAPAQDKVLEITLPDGMSSLILPIAMLISALMVSSSILYATSKLTGSGTTLGATEETTKTDEVGAAGTDTDTTAETPGDVLGTLETFTEYDADICKEDGKPVVYLFSTTWCPHCEWIKDTFDSWAKDNSDKIAAYHWELDTGDNTLTSDTESEVDADANSVYQLFNPNGSIPTFVFGCKYGRVGNGFEAEDDLRKETAAFDAVLDELI